MKKIKDYTWKHWIVIYIVFFILLNMISTLFKNGEGVSIIPTNFIFITVLLIHFLIAVRNQKEARLKYPLMAFISLIIIQTAVSEFYGRPLTIFKVDIIRTAFAALLLILIISYARNRLRERKETKKKIKEVVSQVPDEEINHVTPEELSKEKPKEEAAEKEGDKNG